MAAVVAMVGMAAITTSSFDSSAAAASEDGVNGAHWLKMHNRVSLGNGFVETLYASDWKNRPKALGVRVSGDALNSLPTDPTNDGATCFDTDGDGIDLEADCVSGHERNLWFPELNGLPFKWLMFNWQPVGHGPPYVFDEPHFDLHFFIQDMSARNQIRTGSCHLVINCADRETAMKPVPAPYAPEGWGLPGAAGRMGNHIVDPQAPPANGGPFEQAFAYGTWDGHISFWEPVVNKTWVLSLEPGRFKCRAIPQTPAVELSGYYPRRMCTIRERDGGMLFRMDRFAWREAPADAQPPGWMR